MNRLRRSACGLNRFMAAEPVCVEVAYALPAQQRIVAVTLPAGSNAVDAVKAADLARYFPEFSLDPKLLGLWGIAFGTKGLPKAADYCIKDGDRIECYRPLTCDPMEVRRRRAAKAVQKRSGV